MMPYARTSRQDDPKPGNNITVDVQNALKDGSYTDEAARFLGQDPKAFKRLNWAQPLRVGLGYGHRAFVGDIQTLTAELAQTTNALKSARQSISRKHLSVLVSNLVDAYFAYQDDTEGPPRWVYYSRAKGDPAFSRRNKKDNPFGLSVESNRKAVDALSEAGLAECYPAVKNVFQSRMRATDQLMERLARAGALDLSVILGEPKQRPLIVLKANDGTEGAVVGTTAATDRTEAILGPVNERLASSTIEIATTDLTELRKLGRRGVNPQRRRLYRIFREPDIPSRLEGGFWTNMPKDLRPLIRVDGEPVAEADFQAMQLHLLYHLDGLNLWDEFEGDDPFSLPDLPDVSREIVKLVFNAVTNTDTDTQAHSAARNKLRKRLSDGGKGLDLKRVIATLKATHQPITRHRGKEAWKRLQQVESDILLTVLERGVADGVPTLPIHDAALVPASKAEWLTEAMAASLELNGITSRPRVKGPLIGSAGSSSE